MNTDDDQPATKRDLTLAISELKTFVVDRELVALRWVITIQITYFFGTLVTMWFLLPHYK
jgi:hypothetical protein